MYKYTIASDVEYISFDWADEEGVFVDDRMMTSNLLCLLNLTSSREEGGR